MHMADALLSPAVGGGVWAITAAGIAYASQRLRARLDDRTIPLMGVMGAFVFAAQMINFTIPGTGSSGHLGGGLLLAAVLGPHAGFLAMASILTVQALFFADGGLLALGCNMFNLGVFPCYVAYPFLYRTISRGAPSPIRTIVASLVGAVAGLQLGAFAVVLETVLSGITALPFRSFVLAMQPIHLAIGTVEGLVTAAVINFVRAMEPGIGEQMAGEDLARQGRAVRRKVLFALLVVAVVMAGGVSWFASDRPDGLEWSMARVSGQEELAAPDSGAHGLLARIQETIAFLPDYGFKPVDGKEEKEVLAEDGGKVETSSAGLVGGALTLLVIAVAGLLLKPRPRAGV